MYKHIPELVDMALTNESSFKLAVGLIYKNRLLKCYVNDELKHAEEACFK